MAFVRRGARVRLVLTMLLLAGCTGGAGPAPTRMPMSSGTSGSAYPATPGDVAFADYDAATTDLALTGGLDPLRATSPLGIALLSQMLVRTLVTYRHVSGPDGWEPMPDLATDTGTVSADGLSWTFTLKEGVMFGPPLSREITSADVEYTFRRMSMGRFGGPHRRYFYGLVRGMEEARARMPDRLEGVETPDERTVVFHLRRPAGDFPHRLALPISAPMPEEVAGCFANPGEYGRHLVSTAGYMIASADLADATSCETLEPLRGFQPDHGIRLVRNPDYDQATDSREVRSNNLEELRIARWRSDDAIASAILSGRLDGGITEPLPRGAWSLFRGDRADQLRVDPVPATAFLTMNLLVPPFDDVHVRRAVNLALDKVEVAAAAGAPQWAIAGSIFPPPDPAGADYDPYAATPDERLDLAKAEMRLSPYDADGDGWCEAEVCKDIVFLPQWRPPDSDTLVPILQGLGRIGIQVSLREIDCGNPCTQYETVDNLIAIALVPAQPMDFLDPGAWASRFHSRGITCEDQLNYSEVGMTREQAGRCGVEMIDDRPFSPPVSVDDEIEECEAAAGSDRSACWDELERTLMEDVVPWAPLRWGSATTVIGEGVVNSYEFDPFSGMIAFCHISVPSK